jgi:flagellar hook-basal body complex protein FliE
MIPVAAARAAQALAAYSSVDQGTPGQGTQGQGTQGLDGQAPAGATAFSSLLGQSLNDAIDTGHQAEALSLSAIHGSGDLTQVVTAVSKAEIALQTTVALRDRVLQAYQDIIKMPI